MPLTQFSFAATAGGQAFTGSQTIETGILESVTAILEDPLVDELPCFVHIYLAGSTDFPTGLIASLGSGYINAINPAQWTGAIHLFPGCRIVCRAQTTLDCNIRVGLITHQG